MNKINVSGGIYYSFENLSKCDNFINFVSSNKVDFDTITKNFNISEKECVRAEQVHGDNVSVVGLENSGTAINNTDALVTNTPNLCILVRTADCLPLLLYDPIKKVFSAVHAGWKGTLKNITKKSIEVMVNKFKINPTDLIVGIGPSISKRDYLVKHNVADKFIDSGYEDFLNKVSSDQWELDLLGVNLTQLIRLGIPKSNIEVSGISTFTSEDFYSYRRGDKKEFITGGVICE